jgi:hypothetical protein
VDTSNSNNKEAAVSPEIVRQIRAALSDVLSKATPVPPGLEGLPIELWLERIVPTAAAADLLNLTPETLLTNPEYRSKLIPLDGRKYGMRLRDALKLEPEGSAIPSARKKRPARSHAEPAKARP